MDVFWFVKIRDIVHTFLFLLFTIICWSLTLQVSAHNNNNKTILIVHMNEHGFVPEEIEITKGTEIIFENVGINMHWPASDNHPSHTLYSGTTLDEHCSDGFAQSFDSCGPIAPGETWSFVFAKNGTYTYHDHLWPHLGGKITVVSTYTVGQESNSIKTIILNFFRNIFSVITSLFSGHNETLVLQSGNTDEEFYKVLKSRFENIVLDSDPREAIRILQEESHEDTRISALCHDILHSIGHAAYKKYGTFQEAVQYQSDFCNSGYIHGLFEAYFNTSTDPLPGLAEQCTKYGEGKRLFDLWQCYHGIGHGFMYLTGGDLDESLLLCAQHLIDELAISSCQNGAYMEVFNLEILAKESRFVDPNNPFMTCQVRATNKNDCYVYIPSYFSQTLQKDFIDIFQECKRAEAGYISICINGIGAEAIKRNMNNVNSMFTLCRQVNSNKYQHACIEGVVSMYMNQSGSYEAGEGFCESAPESYKDACHSAVRGREWLFR